MTRHWPHGVRAFQQRHGLAADGVLGKATLAQLQVPPAARVRQLELMLERLRWTPLMQGPRMVVINIPEFMLRAYEVRGERIVVRETMKIIVGKAMNTRTPLFVEQMRFIEFQPFWNVPPSIARGEVVPRLRRDPGLLGPRRLRVRRRRQRGHGAVGDAARRNRRGPRAHPPAARTEECAGRHQVRVPEQRQHLPASHAGGAACSRATAATSATAASASSEPVALALFVLQDRPEWTEERIRAAMSDGASHDAAPRATASRS